MRHTAVQAAEFDTQLVQPPQGVPAVSLAGLSVAALVIGDQVGRFLVDRRSTAGREALGFQPGAGRLVHLLDGQVERSGRFFL